MPSLSIVIPYRQHDQRLEDTILSVLENRPLDCEVIVVHDGSYSDPYELSDEVVFVEVEPKCSIVGLFNAGAFAACSPVINTLLDGTIVNAGWSQTACAALAGHQNVAAVASPITRERALAFGLDLDGVFEARSLQASNLLNKKQSRDCAGPELACGFYRRKVLMALGGFNETLDVVGTGVDFAWALDALELDCICDRDGEPIVSASLETVLSTASLQKLAGLGVAYELFDSDLSNSITEFVRGCLSGHPIAAYAWSAGLSSVPTHSPAVRIALAKEHLARNVDRLQVLPAAPQNRRRAA